MNLRPVIFGLAIVLTLTGTASASVATSTLRIVSLVPSQTEMLFALGFGDSIVGVTDYCTFPEAARGLPRCGSLDLNLEAIVALNPTHVIDFQSMHRRYQASFERFQIRYLDYPLRSITELPLMAASMAADLGRPEAAAEFCRQWASFLPSSGNRTEMPSDAPRVFVEVWNTPLQGAAPGSFLGELVALAGGRNILASAGIEFPVVNSETVVREDPQIILLTYPASDTSEVLARPGWQGISAVRRSRVYRVDQDLYVRPGPRLMQAYTELKRLLQTASEP